MTARPHHAPARTTLAWRRNGIALLAAGLVLARGIATAGVEPHPVRGLAIAALGLLAWSSGEIQARRRHPPAAGGDLPVARLADLVPTALGTAALGIAATVLALVP